MHNTIAGSAKPSALAGPKDNNKPWRSLSGLPSHTSPLPASHPTRAIKPRHERVNPGFDSATGDIDQICKANPHCAPELPLIQARPAPSGYSMSE